MMMMLFIGTHSVTTTLVSAGALEPCHAIPEALLVRFPGPCGGVRGTPISTLSAKRCVFATIQEASGGQKRPSEALEPCHAIPETLLVRFPAGGLQFQHLARNVAFSQRFRRPPGVRNAPRRP